MREHNHLVQAAKTVISAIEASPAGSFLVMGIEAEMISGADALAGSQRALTCLEAMVTLMPGAGKPIMVEKEKGGAVAVSFGGIRPAGTDVATIEAAINAVALVEEIVPGPMKRGDPEVFVFGRDGRMNVGERLMAAWARSPYEAVAKLHAQLHPGIGTQPSAALDLDLHREGRIVMRSQDDWRKHDIDDLVARVRDEIALFAETDKNPESDDYYGFG